MDVAVVLARVWGVACVVVGLSLLNRKNIGAVVSGLESSRALFWLTGFVTVVLGAVSLAVYGAWDGGWQVLLTILGWLALIKGVAITLWPSSLMSFYRKFKVESLAPISGAIALVIGIILLYVGFVA